MIIILPGYSLHNKDWANEVRKNLKTKEEAIVHEWEHWKSGKSMNLKSEVENIRAKIGKEKVSFIAKSVGTRVFVTLAPHITTQIQKVILCGIPIDPLKYAKGFKAIKADQISVIQNSKDPFMPASLIKLYLKVIDKNIKVIEKEASNHDYPYFEEFNEFLGLD